MSVIEVEYPVTFENGIPKDKGLADLRMGNISGDFNCATCEADGGDCPGHFGHINLAKPVFHINFIKTVVQILRSVCLSCSKLKTDLNDDRFNQALKLPPKDRLSAVYKICSSINICDDDTKNNKKSKYKKKTPHLGCGCQQPKIKKDGFKLTLEYQDAVGGMGKKEDISAEQVHEILKNISSSDCLALGLHPKYSRPDWMIVTALPVPPPQVRPTIFIGSTNKGEDDLTSKLAQIIRENNNLKKAEENGLPEHIVHSYTQLLQYHIATYFNNEIPGQYQDTTKSGRPIKSICQRLKGKEGRVRGNLMGKRVDFSARTVITPDPNISIDEVGVPRSIAKTLTIPDIVTPWNYKELRQLVLNGPNQHPGALYVIRENGDRDDLRYVKDRNDVHLSYGDKVERHLNDGDVVIFNRQPSLHKMSMMGHRVRVMPYSTFRLNLSVTTPYNADFDGDEMNMHVPQSLETKSEVINIMMVPKQIVSQNNKPAIGLVQDTLLGTSLFTRRDCFMEKDVVMNLMMWIPNFDGKLPVPAILKPLELWSGKQIFSMLIPQQTNLHLYSSIHQRSTIQNKWMSCTDTEVVIENGQILAGIIDKSTIGKSEGGIIHTVWIDRGPEAAKNFLNASQQLINNWLCQRGYTIGYGDTIADKKTVKNIIETIESSKKEVKCFIENLMNGTLEQKPGMSILETFESSVNRVLNLARDGTGQYASRSLDRNNNIKLMVDSGSKGSFINIGQMIACVGQQNVEGKRISYGFKQRTLPHFPKDDYDVESRGFVMNSYLRGLTPQEFFYHAMGGREGVIDTAVKTSETGYIQRRLVKAMEDMMIHYDGTVRNSQSEVIQFLYGEDGMDGTGVEKQQLETFTLDDKALEEKYKYNFDSENLGLLGEFLDVEELKNDVKIQELLEEEYQIIKAERDLLRREIIPMYFTKEIVLPCNLKRLILNVQKEFALKKYTKTDLSPQFVIQMVKELCSNLSVMKGNDDATMLLKIHLRSLLASKRLINEFYFTQESFLFLLGEIESRFKKSIAHPGEMVGAIAAQSIGEPATQMTLNTFHYAGVSAKNVTLGVPRIQEIINISKNTNTPGLTVYIQPNHRNDSEFARQILINLEYTKLGDVVTKTEIWYDPDIHQTVCPKDQELVSLYHDPSFLFSNVKEELLSKWVLRLEFDKEKIMEKKINLELIEEKIKNRFDNFLYCIYSDTNAENLVMRIRFVEDEGEDEEFDNLNLMKLLENSLLNEIVLCGVNGISKVFISHSQNDYVMEDGSIAKKNEWILNTQGSNLLETLAIQGVDSTRTYSNNIIETCSVLGIEAVRQTLLRELKAVISFDGTYVNYRHFATLVDVMTHRGYLMSITRHGINRHDSGPLKKCSFEETVDMITEAATYAEVDELKGISENIIVANTPPLGTGSFDLLLNYEMLSDAIDVEPTIQRFIYPENDLPWSSPSKYDPTASPLQSPFMSDYNSVNSPQFSPYSATSPYHQSSPGFSDTSPYSPGYNPTSPSSPSYNQSNLAYHSASSPGYNLTSPLYSPTSPGYNPISPAYDPASPKYSNTSNYSPTSPKYIYSPPSTPYYGSPTSPAYSPSSPAYSPTSPAYSPTSPAYSPTSPYTPTTPAYSPTSPYTPLSPAYSPTSPYTPLSPAYSPTSPVYSPSINNYTLNSPQYTPTSPSYTPNINK